MSIYHHFISIKLDSWLEQTKAVVDQIKNYSNFTKTILCKRPYLEIYNFSVYLVLVYIITKAKTIIKYHLEMILIIS